MPSQTTPKKTRDEIITALCLLHHREKASHYFQYASVQDEEKLKALSLSSKGRYKDLLVRIQRRESLSHLSALQEIHPGWIVEKLQNESPRLLGLVCRFLSHDQIKTLRQFVPTEKKKFLPKTDETFSLSPPVLEIVSQFFEKKFLLPSQPASGSLFSLPHMAWMSSGDLRTVFWDLGLEEIRKAFSGVEPQVLRVFLTRFPLKLAKEIRDRIDLSRKVLPEEKRAAQKHLVSLQLDDHLSEELFREIGYSVFAQALSPGDLSWAQFVYEKLPPVEGHRLKRVLEGRVAEAENERKKAEILDRIQDLTERGLIRQYWKKKKT